MVKERAGDRQIALRTHGQRLGGHAPVGRKPVAAHRLGDAAGEPRPPEAVAAPEVAQVLLDRELVVEGELLGDVADLGAHLGLGLAKIPAHDLDLSARRRKKAAEHAEGRGLARAVGPEQAEDLSALHVKGRVSDRHEAAERARKIARADRHVARIKPPRIVGVGRCGRGVVGAHGLHREGEERIGVLHARRTFENVEVGNGPRLVPAKREFDLALGEFAGVRGVEQQVDAAVAGDGVEKDRLFGGGRNLEHHAARERLPLGV